MIVRADLPHRVQKAQTVHAAGESVRTVPVPRHTRAVHRAARDEPHLQEVSRRLLFGGVEHSLVVEGDPPYVGQLTAIGVPPQDRERILSGGKSLRQLLADLPTSD